VVQAVRCDDSLYPPGDHCGQTLDRRAGGPPAGRPSRPRPVPHGPTTGGPTTDGPAARSPGPDHARADPGLALVRTAPAVPILRPALSVPAPTDRARPADRGDAPGVSGHQPVRPAWSCAACGVDWPCPTRQRELARDNAATWSRLGLVMARDLDAAMADRPDIPVSALYLRFLGWLGPRPEWPRSPERPRPPEWPRPPERPQAAEAPHPLEAPRPPDKPHRSEAPHRAGSVPPPAAGPRIHEPDQ